MAEARATEIEIKLRVEDLAAMRRRLNRAGARQMTPRRHEANTLYDTPQGGLARHGQMLRIRAESPAGKMKAAKSRPRAAGRSAHAPQAILTFKGPATLGQEQTAALGRRYKIREESEVTIGDPIALGAIFEALGLRPYFRYEKLRTAYALPGLPSLKVVLDETPIGAFLELEGSPANIDRGAARLGFSPSDYITQTYAGLYLAHCRRQGLPPADMLFQKGK